MISEKTAVIFYLINKYEKNIPCMRKLHNLEAELRLGKFEVDVTPLQERVMEMRASRRGELKRWQRRQWTIDLEKMKVIWEAD